MTLPQAQGVSITTDLWQSKNNDSFISFTCHYIDYLWKFQKFVLACQPFPGTHTGEKIAKIIDDQIREMPGLKEDTLKVLVHDSGSNMIAASKKSNESDDFFRCADHRLNLVQNHAEKDSKVFGEALEKFTTLASKTHRSSLHQNTIRQACAKVKGNIPFYFNFIYF